jgi:hypothetical protein
MRFLSVILSFTFIFSSCSIAPYDQEKNCSERGLNALKSDAASAKNSTEEDKNTIAESLKKFYSEHAKDIQSCYQAYLDSSSSNRNEYAVCTVVTIKSGELTFLDVADKENGLDAEIQKCIEDKFHSFDYKVIDNKYSYTVQQPYYFKTRRL